MNARKRFFSALLAGLLLMLCACSAPSASATGGATAGASAAPEYPIYLESYALGTVCRQTIYAGGDAGVAKDGEALLYDIDARMSLYRATSEVDAINGSGGAVSVSTDTFGVIKKALDVSAKTNGAFDISMGILTSEWDITNNPHVPDDALIKQLLTHVGYAQITAENGTITTPADVMIDLGGIAKGAAADELCALYHERGVTSALINLGGNIYAFGKKPDGSPFRIGIGDPENDANYFATVEISGVSLVTSGAYERNFTAPDGTFYHHILDPATGYPANNGLISVSILSEDCALADAMSTAIYVLGAEKGLAAAKSAGVDAIVVTEDKRVLATEGCAAKYALTLTNGAYTMGN